MEPLRAGKDRLPLARRGAPLQSDEHVAKLEGVVAQLNEAQSAVKYEKKSLAQLLAGLQQFMEDALGINVSGEGGRGGMRMLC